MGDEDSSSGWDEAGDPEAGDKSSSSGWDVADEVEADDEAEFGEELPLSG